MSIGNDTDPGESPSPEEEAEIQKLTASDLQRIDDCLLSHVSIRQQKVARVIASAMIGSLGEQFPRIPDVFYSQRIKHLVEQGAIEAFGSLDRMRYSEIRLKSVDKTA
jgi:hypothetical protein